METRYLMSAGEIQIARGICTRYGPEFDGIRHRVDLVAKALRRGTCEQLADAGEELLCSLSAHLAAEIAPNWKRPALWSPRRFPVGRATREDGDLAMLEARLEREWVRR